jgi:hypothetical protein
MSRELKPNLIECASKELSRVIGTQNIFPGNKKFSASLKQQRQLFNTLYYIRIIIIIIIII